MKEWGETGMAKVKLSNSWLLWRYGGGKKYLWLASQVVVNHASCETKTNISCSSSQLVIPHNFSLSCGQYDYISKDPLSLSAY